MDQKDQLTQRQRRLKRVRKRRQSLAWKTKPGDPSWLRVATKYLGVKEVPGQKSNGTIVGWLRKHAQNISARYQNLDSTAWCAVFVSACLAEAGYPATNHALAIKYANYGRPTPLRRGCILVIKRKKEGADKRTGSRRGYHVTFLLEDQKNYYKCRGGNQRDSVRYSYYLKSKYEVIAARWPNLSSHQPRRP